MFAPNIINFDTSMVTKEKFPWTKFISIIDESGSTNNSYGRGRGGRSRFRTTVNDEANKDTTDEETTDEVKTKVIYLAEEEALAHIYVELANKYDMTGVTLVLASFSTTCKPELTKVLQSSLELYNLAKQINTILNKEFGSTNLTLALETILTDFKDTLLILASDGRPDDCTSTLTVLDNIIEQFNKNEKRLDIFCIGVGSIQESTNGSSNYVSRRGHLNLDRTNEELLSRVRSSSSAECNQEFLQALTEKGNTGGYAGAFKDYSQLMIGFKNFLANLRTWKVILDTGLMDLDPVEQQIMNDLSNDGNKFAIVFRPNFGHYVLCSNGLQSYQLAVKKVDDYNSLVEYPTNEKYKQCFINDPHQLSNFYDFNKLFVNNLSDACKQVVFVTGDKEYYCPEILYGCQFRIRRLCLLN